MPFLQNYGIAVFFLPFFYRKREFVVEFQIRVEYSNIETVFSDIHKNNAATVIDEQGKGIDKNGRDQNKKRGKGEVGLFQKKKQGACNIKNEHSKKVGGKKSKIFFHNLPFF